MITIREVGGFRRYNLDPQRIKHQAQVIARAPVFMKLLEEFVEYTDSDAENPSDDLTKLAQVARRILEEIKQ